MEHKRQDCGCCGQAGTDGAGLSRRGALARLWYGALALCGLTALAGCPGGSTYGRETAAAGTAPGGSQVDGTRTERLEFDKRTCHPGEAIELDFNGVKVIAAQNRETKGKPRWVALDRRCTHNKCLIHYDTKASEFICPCHGSRFNFKGEPIFGPARLPLKSLRIEEGPVMVTVFASQPPVVKKPAGSAAGLPPQQR